MPSLVLVLLEITDLLTLVSLALGDDTAADLAGPGEKCFQGGAVFPTDGALQCAQVLGKTSEHFQHGLFVMNENIAPHDGIGASDPGEICEAAG